MSESDIEDIVEHDNSNVALILLRGVEDLPDKVSGAIAGSLHATAFDSNWQDKESFREKLNRLDKLVDQTLQIKKEIILIGVSAGGGLGMAYMLEYPQKIRHLFSLDGLVDPNLPVNLNKGKMTELCEDNPSFKEMSELLTGKLHLPDGELNQELIKNYHLPDKISTYSSGADEIVPLAVSEPSWIVNKRRVGEGKHATSIARTLIFDLRHELKPLNEANFD